MRAWLIVLAGAIGSVGCDACGGVREGSPLGRASELAIVAHQDDDLLFMQPDLHDAARAGGLVTIYVTAGNGRGGTQQADERYEGLMHAYSVVTGAEGWRCGVIAIAEHAAQHCRLDEANLSLVFLGYPDGGKQGEVPASLLHLWQGDIASATTIASRETTYTRAGLIETLAAAIDVLQPRVVRTLELASTHGRDHSDHMVVGALAMLATAASHQHPELVSYRGYSIELEPATAIEPLYLRARAALARYEACATGCAPCGDACTRLSESHDVWLHRRYAIGIRRRAAGVLRAADGTCLGFDARRELTLGECATATRVELATDGTLRLATDRCLEVQGSRVTASHDCTPASSRRVFLDDEGHLWLGTPPPPEPAMDYRHARCLDAAAGQLVVATCGADHAPVWELVHELIRRPRPAGLADRDVRPADHDVRLADHAAPTWLGDLDGDRRGDVCVAGPAGVQCSRAADHALTTALVPWSFVMGGKVDGVPHAVALAGIADIDGDGRGDLCRVEASPPRIACTRSQGHGFGPSFTLATLGATMPSALWLEDADGDGLADACVDEGSMIACTRSR